nr:PIN domain-containing protein [Oceanivirga miroungae]
MTSQVYNEFYRNRESKINDALSKFKYQKIQFPNFIKSYENEYFEIKKISNELEEKMKNITEKVKLEINNFKIPVDEILLNFFDSDRIEVIDDYIIDKAIRRFDLGNPPGKDKSYGDAINWVYLLKKIPVENNLYFISDDKDFASLVDKNKFSVFLSNEWEKEKNKK